MLPIPETTIDEIVKRTDLVDLAARVGLRLKEKSKGDFWACCPFHREKSASFHIVQRRGFYKCFGCGASGSAVRFWRETQGLGFRDAIVDLADMAGVSLDDQTPVDTTRRKPVVVDQTPPAETAADTHAKRKGAKDRWWTPTLPIKGTVAETYLVEARAVSSHIVRAAKPLRFLPDAPYWAPVDGPDASGKNDFQVIHRGPAMVAGMQYPDGQFAAAHVTFLARDGSGKLDLWKRPPSKWDDGEKFVAKKVMGAPGGAAIRLGAADTRMAVAEGIETGLSCMTEGGPVTWVAYSLHNMAGAALDNVEGKAHPEDARRKLPPEWPDLTRPGFTFPSVCDWALVIGDGDTKDMHANRALLRRAVHKFRFQGIDAGYVLTPPGTDLNDMLIADRQCGSAKAVEESPAVKCGVEDG